MTRGRLWILTPLAMLIVLAAPLPTARAGVTSAQVAKTLGRSVAVLKNAQKADGSWDYSGSRLGTTSLAVLALKSTGLPNNDVAIKNGVAYIVRALGGKVSRPTYEFSLAAMALVAVDPVKYRKPIGGVAKWLERKQGKDGTWNYGGGGGGDNSNNQFAVLGLRAAMEAGIDISPVVLERALRHFTKDQHADGGWSYRGPRGRSYGSMTAGGVASLLTLGAKLHSTTARCGKYKEDVRVAAGINWLTKNFTVHGNPSGHARWHFYFLYALERVGIFSARRFFGTHDWYREGANLLVTAEAAWARGNNAPDLAFCILFLAKGSAPIAIQKLTWPANKSTHRYDIQNLTAYAAEKLKRPLAWRTVRLDGPLKDLLAAPILFFNGHDKLVFTQAQRKKLAAYIDNGGTIIAEACGGPKASQAFDKSFRAEIKRILKHKYELHQLSTSHPLYFARVKLNKAQRRKTILYGINVACRTSVIYIPNTKYRPNRGMSCEWDRNLNRFVNPHFKVGLNMVAYIIGKQRLRGPLDEVEPVERERPKVHAGAFIFAQLDHEGDANPHPLAGNRLMDELSSRTGIAIGSQTKIINPADRTLFNYPFVYMTGHNTFNLAKGKGGKKRIENLRKYLTRGGFLLADPCCGEKDFDDAFRKLVKQIFPDKKHKLKLLPMTHEILHVRQDTTTVTYKEAVARVHPKLKRPVLYGVYHDKRLVLVLTKYNIGCGIEQHTSSTCKGYSYDDSMDLAINVILYAMTHN